MEFKKSIAGCYNVISDDGIHIGFINRIKKNQWLMSGYYYCLSNWGQERYEKSYDCETLYEAKRMYNHMFSGNKIIKRMEKQWH